MTQYWCQYCNSTDFSITYVCPVCFSLYNGYFDDLEPRIRHEVFSHVAIYFPTPNDLNTIYTYPAQVALNLLNTDKDIIEVRGYKVRTRQDKYRIWFEMIDCVWCREPGVWMKLQTAGGEYATFNLFAEDGERFFNKDHIMPRSRGGPNVLWNYQNTCQPCNTLKANHFPCTSRFANRTKFYTEREKQEELFMRKNFGHRDV